MMEGLQKIVAQLAQMQLTPDADQEFLLGVQGTITQFLRTAASDTAQQGASLGSQPGMGGPSPAGSPPMGAPNAMAPGGMAGGGMGGLTTPPNPDELRRVLANASATGG